AGDPLDRGDPRVVPGEARVISADDRLIEVAPEELRELPNDQRAPLDAYWTPLHCALACCSALQRAGQSPDSILEPAVGGGSWARAARLVWPDADIEGNDLDPNAPGLADVDRRSVGDFLERQGPGAVRRVYNLVVGNPPYGGDVRPWVERGL